MLAVAGVFTLSATAAVDPFLGLTVSQSADLFSNPLPRSSVKRHQRPELPNPRLPLAPLVNSIDKTTSPVKTGVGTNCAILSPDRIS
jgi:hypothetical protein